LIYQIRDIGYVMLIFLVMMHMIIWWNEVKKKKLEDFIFRVSVLSLSIPNFVRVNFISKVF